MQFSLRRLLQFIEFIFVLSRSRAFVILIHWITKSRQGERREKAAQLFHGCVSS